MAVGVGSGRGVGAAVGVGVAGTGGGAGALAVSAPAVGVVVAVDADSPHANPARTTRASAPHAVASLSVLPKTVTAIPSVPPKPEVQVAESPWQAVEITPDEGAPAGAPRFSNASTVRATGS